MHLPQIDVLSPIDTFIGTLRYGEMHRFTFQPSIGHTPLNVERLLRQYGIRVWGRKIVGTNRSFLVRRTQALWAEYVMCRAGVELVGPLLDERNSIYPSNHPVTSMPRPWTEGGIGPISFIDHIGEWLDSLRL